MMACSLISIDAKLCIIIKKQKTGWIILLHIKLIPSDLVWLPLTFLCNFGVQTKFNFSYIFFIIVNLILCVITLESFTGASRPFSSKSGKSYSVVWQRIEYTKMFKFIRRHYPDLFGFYFHCNKVPSTIIYWQNMILYLPSNNDITFRYYI